MASADFCPITSGVTPWSALSWPHPTPTCLAPVGSCLDTGHSRSRVSPGLGQPVAPAGIFTGRRVCGHSMAPLGRSPRIRTWTFAMQPQHLSYLPAAGRSPWTLGFVMLPACAFARRQVPTYPETGPCMPFLFVCS